MTRLDRFALATVLATLALIAIGSLARLHPAGSGCGNDWPLCNGNWWPALAWDSLVEYAHRVVAIAVITLAATTAVTAFRTPSVPGKARLLAAAALGAILFQSVVGGFAARWGAPAGIAIVHLAAAILFLAFALLTLAAIAAARGTPHWLAELGRAPDASADRPFVVVATFGAATALILLIFGASTSATGALACATWPHCGWGTAGVDTPAVIHLGYRATALLATLAAAGAAVFARRRGASAPARHLAAAAVLLVVLQSGLNALASAAGDPIWISAPHLIIATLFWITMLGVALAAWGPRPEHISSRQTAVADRASAVSTASDVRYSVPPVSDGTLALASPHAALGIGLSLSPLLRVRLIVADYIALTKPGIMTLLLTTTLCAMLIAARGIPPFWLVVVTMLGGALASGGANALNCFIDRDIDAQMARTRNRAVAAGRVSPDAALAFGVTLTVASVLVLGVIVNWTAAALALAGNLYYVFVYTKWLKRATPHNIVIGGAAGAVPPLVGWAAVTGDLSPLAWGLFAIIFAWTPPHFWALALLKQGDYTRAAVPMLPVVSGEAETRRQIVIYTVGLALLCIALTPLGLGAIYLGSALLLNGIFLWFAIRLYFQPSKRVARQMFFFSLWYLALLFTAAVVDRIVIS
jgi:protoheme IX farnesyltransferase